MIVIFSQWLRSFPFESRAKIHVQKRPDIPLSSPTNRGGFHVRKKKQNVGRREVKKQAKNVFFWLPNQPTFSSFSDHHEPPTASKAPPLMSMTTTPN